MEKFRHVKIPRTLEQRQSADVMTSRGLCEKAEEETQTTTAEAKEATFTEGADLTSTPSKTSTEPVFSVKSPAEASF